jgi:hypothetical protein
MVQVIGWLFTERLKVEQESAQLRLAIVSIETKTTNKPAGRRNAGTLFEKIEPDAVSM